MNYKKVFVVYYPYDSKGVIAVYNKEVDAKFLVKTLNNKHGECSSVEYKMQELK